MVLTRQTLLRAVIIFFFLASLPLFGVRRGDTSSSQNGQFGNCPATPTGGPCPVLNSQGAATLSGADGSGNPVTVTVNLYDWGHYPCSATSCQSQPVITNAVLDVTLAGTNIGIQSVVVKGLLPNPGYVSCGGSVGLGCVSSPEPDGFDVQQPTPTAGADKNTFTNTRWDFGGVPPSNPALPAIAFDQLACFNDGFDSICGNFTGEAILVVTNSVAQNHMSTASSNYLITLTDGTRLGTLSVPASPTKRVVSTNNTQATATLITTASFQDYTDTSQAYPQINADGTIQYPQGFALAPVPPPSSNSFPSCYPINTVTGKTDTRIFRTAWYTYTAPSNGSINITTTGSRYDTLIYVFTGSTTQPTSIACDDEPSGSRSLQAGVTFNALQGTSYKIVVYESPTYQTNATGTLIGYPLSVDGALYLNFQFSTIPPTTATTVSSSPNPSIFGQTVNFSAKVTSKRPGIPTGTITISQGSTVLAKGSMSGGAVTIFAIPLATGTNVITATYSGDSNFSSSSGSMSQSVTKATTTLVESSSKNPSGSGQPVTISATIKPQYTGQATGNVTFKDSNGTSLGTFAVKGNVASVTTSSLSIGTHYITAIYSGDSNFGGSTSKAFSQVVKYASTTKLTSSPNPSISGNLVTFKLTVTSPAGTPTGTVQILDGTVWLVTLTLNSGSASFTSSQLGVGSHALTGVYSGNSKIVSSTSAAVKQVVLFPSYFSVLHSFAGGTDGVDPVGGLILDAQGNLYGTTALGGAKGAGTVFKLDTSGVETVLYTFTGGADGGNPYSRLVLDTQGNLYGTTTSGGNLNCAFVGGCGTVFKVTPAGTETVVYSFTGGADGGVPGAGVVRDGQGNLYGTTRYGGNLACNFDGCGTVFKVDTSSKETVLYSFNGSASGDGQDPEGGLTLDTQGNLYGTTYYGGANYNGIVFKLTSAGQESVIYTFAGGPGDGSRPFANVILDSQGNLYGTTSSGGANYIGTVFKVDSVGNETVLYNFTGNGGDGEQPYGGLVLDSQGNLYGTTFNGGSANLGGTVFRLDTTFAETVLYRFTGTGGDGSRPQAGLVIDAQGNLYGTTTSGGTTGNGTVFRVAPPY